MPPAPELKLDLSHDTFQDMARRLSNPMNLHGVDLSSLDARNTPLPSSPSSMDLNPGRSAERQRTRSFFGNLGASRSTSLLQADSNAMRNVQGEALGQQNAGRSPKSLYSMKAAGSTPELSKLLRPGTSDGKIKRLPHLVTGTLIQSQL